MTYIGRIIGRETLQKVFDIAHKKTKYPDKRFDGSCSKNRSFEVGRILLSVEEIHLYCDVKEDYIEWLCDIDDEKR